MKENNQSYEQEKRKRSRISINLNVIINFDGFKINTQTIDISLKGIFCKPHESVKAGKICSVLIWLTEEEKIEVKGQVVRSTSDGMAIDFQKMDIDSFSHLYRLIRYNCNDPDKLDKEFKYPAFVE